MKNKKILISIIIVIALIIIFFVTRELIIANEDGKLNKSNSMTREEIIALLEKGTQCDNYYFSIVDENNQKDEYYVKDNIVACYINSKLKTLTDFNSNTITYFNDSGEIKSTENVTMPQDSQLGYSYSDVTDTQNYDYEYLGELVKNERNIIIIKLKSKDVNHYIKVYIDKDTGLLLGEKEYNKLLFVSQKMFERSRNVKIGIVTDENIKNLTTIQ